MDLATVSAIVLTAIAVLTLSHFVPAFDPVRLVHPFMVKIRKPDAVRPPAPGPEVYARNTAQVAPDGLVIKQLVWAGTLDADFARPYPTLAAIDSARPDGTHEFARDPFAAELEVLATRFISRHWSDLVWLTGLIDQTRFDALCADLERERLVMLARVPAPIAAVSMAGVTHSLVEPIPA